jgi:hypothetical protein
VWSPHDYSYWQASLQDAKLISDINLPGTHDSAAIGAYVQSFWICQDFTITQQLMYGIRLFDIRLQVHKDQAYYFVTCHGNLGYDYFKTFQTYRSVLDEFKEFLESYPTEFIVMQLKIDDYSGFALDKSGVRIALDELAASYPNLFYLTNHPNVATPTVGEMRGKIYVLNRVSTSNDIGVPVSWDDD